MKKMRLVCALAVALIGAGVVAEARGKPSTVPVGPPATPVEHPTAPPENPPDSLTGFVCSILPVPYLCD